MQVLVHIQKKYVCKACEETIKTAQKPKQPIPKSIAIPGLLSYVLTYKYQHHLPLYHQEKLFQGIGVDIPRATLSHWVIRCAQLLETLVTLLANIKGYDIAYSERPHFKSCMNRVSQHNQNLICGALAEGHRVDLVMCIGTNRTEPISTGLISLEMPGLPALRWLSGLRYQGLSPNAAKHYRQEKATKIINKLKKKLDENQEKASVG